MVMLSGDDKAGIVVIMKALKVIKEKNLSHGPIEVVFSICEEDGLKKCSSALNLICLEHIL